MSERQIVGVLVGFGNIGRIHYPSLRAADGCRLKYVVDVMAERPQGLHDDVVYVRDLGVALGDEEVGFVMVCGPTQTHYDTITRALEAGKHVFTEKPVTTGKEKISSLYKLASAQGRLLFTAFNRRYDPFINDMKSELRLGTVGRPISTTITSRDHPYPSTGYLAVSGNIFRDCAIHDLDQICWIFEERPVSVKAMGTILDHQRSAGTWESTQTVLRFPSNHTAVLFHSRISTSYDQRIEILCQHGVCKVDNPPSSGPLTYATRYPASYKQELLTFMDMLHQSNIEPNITLSHALFLEDLIDACDRSATTNEEVQLCTSAG